MKKDDQNINHQRKYKYLNRRSFLKLMSVFFISIITFLLYGFLSELEKKKIKKKRYTFSIPEDGLHFIDEFIVYKDGEALRVFPARCTHLGCKLNYHDGQKIICKCHQSNFSFDGKVLSGPAIESLKSLSVMKDEKKGIVIVTL